MKKIFVLMLAFSMMAQLQAQPIEQELYNLLQNGDYRKLVNKVCLLREKEYYKNAFMDYCLAYGYCKLNKPAIANQWFTHILTSYNNLSAIKRNELQALQQSCANTHTATGSTQQLLNFLSSMSSEGFQGNSTGIESKMGIPSLSDTIAEFDFENLTFDTQNRQFTLQQKKQAQKYYSRLLGSTPLKSDTTKHFLVFHPGNAFDINRQLAELEQYYTYYSNQFNLTTSNRLIVIFYCTSRQDFTNVANDIHKIPVPKSTFGYASSIDLVMMGIASPGWLGAMKHELFHLMIRSYVGDIPAWLDEGTACFFESSRLKNDSVSTNANSGNYRIRLLYGLQDIKREMQYNSRKNVDVPAIKEIVHFSWPQFSGTSGEPTIKASINQSISYAFVVFLKQQNWLTATLTAFRNRSYIEQAVDENGEILNIMHLKSVEELIREVTHQQPEQVYQAFTDWCNSKGFRIGLPDR